MGSGNLGDLNESTRQLHLETLKQELPGVNFPASREEVACAAKHDGAPQEFVDTIRNKDAPTSFNSLEEFSEWLLGKYLETLQQYLTGVNFPADREEVASAASRNGAPQEIVEPIRNKDARTSFNSLVVLLVWWMGGVLAGKRPHIIVLEDLLPLLPREPD
jgi:Protein of unknown function (DUF2795)